MKLAARHIARTEDVLYEILAKHTGQTIDKVRTDCDRDNFMFADEALAYGLIDKILK
jgi:ATP-dependent Clp protease protease subunit